MEQIFVLREPRGTRRVTTPKDLFAHAKRTAINHEQENCIVFYLNNRHRVFDYEVLFKGGLGCCVIDARTIFRQAVMKSAASIALAHNHPSGDLHPADADMACFRRLQDAGKLLEIEVIDFLIFNRTQFYSCVTEEST